VKNKNSIKKRFDDYPTSKKGLIASYVVSISISAIIVYESVFGVNDMSNLTTVCCACWAECGVYSGFYLWKSKVENRAKYAQMFIKDLAKEYPLSDLAPIIQSVIQD